MPAPDSPRHPSLGCRIVLMGALALGAGAGCSDTDDANRTLLKTFPLDRRVDLLENLRRFDALPAADQTAIRQLNASLGALKPDERTRYLTLIQQYHAWLQGLTEEQRTSLRTVANPEERFRLARQLRLASAEKVHSPGARIARLRSGDFGLIGPFEMGSLLQTWFALTPERRAAIDRLPWMAIPDELKAQGRALNLRPETLPLDEEKRFDAQLKANGEFRPLIEARIGRVEQATRNGKVEAARKAENALRRDEHTFAQFLYFEAHPPKAVVAERLTRFADTCPEWLHAQTDSLAADDARAYYTILYRRIYPPPKEMPEAAPTGQPKVAVPSKGTAPRTGPTNPVF